MTVERARAEALDPTTVHELLSNGRRYHLLTLLEEGETNDVGALAEAIATMESDGEEATESVRQSVYVALIQSHLPKLDELGVVDYDEDDKTAAKGPAFAAVVGYMNPDESREFLYPLSYWAVAIVGLTGLLWAFPIHVLAGVALLAMALVVIVSLSIVEGLDHVSGDLRLELEEAGLVPRSQ